MRRKFLVLMGISALLNACLFAPRGSADDCPVTEPPQPPFSPPIQAGYDGHFWYGTPALWTILPTDGVWQELPRDASAYVQKIAFWREGFDPFDEPNPALELSGRRLDAYAPEFNETDTTHGWDDAGSFMLIGASIPSEGCWEIIAEYQHEQLTFIVQVTP